MHYAQFTKKPRVRHTHGVRHTQGSVRLTATRDRKRAGVAAQSCQLRRTALLTASLFSRLLSARPTTSVTFAAAPVSSASDSSCARRRDWRRVRPRRARPAAPASSTAPGRAWAPLTGRQARSVHRRVTPVPEGPRRGSRCNGDALWAMHARVTDVEKVKLCYTSTTCFGRSSPALPLTAASRLTMCTLSVRVP